MLDGKFIATILGLGIVTLAICNLSSKKKVSSQEGFGMLPSRTWKVDRVAAASPAAAQKGDFFSVPGTYQAMLNPRFSNVQYGANIKYNMPSYENQAVPCDPLTFGGMASESYGHRENFTSGATTREGYGCGSCGGGCSAVSCRKGGAPKSFHGGAPLMQADYADGNYNQMIDQANMSSQYMDTSAMVPVGDMTTVNALGETVQPIVYDRFIYANRNSRLRGAGDPIRGDLPIVPCAPGWFRPSVTTNDLQQGALAVMGGYDNSQGQAMAELINATSGDTTIAGINMSSMRNQFVGSALADISVTAFP